MLYEGPELPEADPALPLAAWPCADRVAELCRAEFGDALGDIRVCRPVEAIYNPGRYLRVAFVLLDDPALAPERYWPAGQIVSLHGPVRRPMSRRGRIVNIDGAEFELYRFPDDRHLRGLKRIASQHALERWLRMWMPQLMSGPAKLKRIGIRYVPGQKFVARVNLRGAAVKGGHDPSIAIRCVRPAACASLKAIRRAVQPLLGQDASDFHFPKLIATDTQKGLIAERWVRGPTLLDSLASGPTDELLGRLTASMNRFGHLPIPPQIFTANHRRDVESAVSDLAGACPDLFGPLSSLQARLLGRLKRLATVPMRLVHNDLHPRQVLVQRKSLYLIDVDRLVAGDPMIDVAAMAFQLGWLPEGNRPPVSQETASRWVNTFLSSWTEASGESIDAERFNLHTALAALKHARGMMRHLRTGWRTTVVRCLEHAQAAVDSHEPVQVA